MLTVCPVSWVKNSKVSTTVLRMDYKYLFIIFGEEAIGVQMQDL